jgi:hypothetical protein
MAWMKVRAVAAAGLLLFLGGCANWYTAYRSNSIGRDRPEVITTDAKQRHTVMIPHNEWPDDFDAASKQYSKARLSQEWRVCAEPSPDVFSAISESASAALKADVKGQSGEARVAVAVAEAAGTIERTQTINLLRESMYRTCERYLSGALVRDAFVVQAGRDSRAMVAILAIEQLTRAARPPSTILVAGGTATSVTNPSDWVQALKDAQAEKRAAEQNLKVVTDANNADSALTCTDEKDAAQKDDCAKKKAAVANIEVASYEKNAADVRYDVIAQAAKTGSSPGVNTAGTTAGTPQAGGSPSGSPTATDLSNVAFVVQHIADKVFEVDETQMFCIQSLSKGTHLIDGIGDACQKYLLAKVKFERSLLDNPKIKAAAADAAKSTAEADKKLILLLERADATQYDAIVQEIQRTMNYFCRGKSKEECINAVSDGTYDDSGETAHFIDFINNKSKGTLK